MDNVFLIDDELENTNQDYINENNIIYRQPDLSECEDNKSGIYDIHKLIYKDISRENILLSSKDLKDNSAGDADTAPDSKTLKFDLSLNKSGGVNWKKNVIGFRLNECIFTSPVYNITTKNNIITVSSNFNMGANSEIPLTIDVGYYTVYTLQNAINTNSQNKGEYKFELNYNPQPDKYTITNKTTNRLTMISNNNPLLKLCGFLQTSQNLVLDSLANQLADTHPALNIGTYLDIVVDEIPYGACKQNPKGLNIIHRIPIRSESGSSIVYYKSNFIDHNYQHLFPPMNLSHLTVHLYMDGQELPLENLTISFEFELVILNK